MKKTILLIAASGLLAACAVSPDMRADIELPTCDILAIPEKCDNDTPPGNSKSHPKVTFNKNSLLVAPRNVCALRGSTLTVQIAPAAENKNPPGSVMVVPKKGEDTWLIGTNSSDNTMIEIEIPDYATKPYYEYTIVSVDEDGVKCVDPRVAVE